MRQRRLADNAGQKKFEFFRVDQLWMLRTAKLPKVAVEHNGRTKTVKPRDLIDVMRVIDDHGQGCWPNLTTICTEARMSRRTVIAAIAALEKISLLIIIRERQSNGSMRHFYTIPWNELALLCQPRAGNTWEPAPVPTWPDPSSHRRTGSAQEAPIVMNSVGEIIAQYAHTDAELAAERMDYERLKGRYLPRVEILTQAEALQLIPDQPVMASRPQLFAAAYMQAMEALESQRT